VRESFIVGEGGHARVIASMLRAPSKFVTTDPANEDSALTQLVAEHANADFYVGIGNNIGRRRVAEKLLALGGRLPACIAPNAFIARDAEIADAAVICLGSQIGSRARIGFACIVNTLSSVDHDCILGDVTQVTAGVTFGGDGRRRNEWLFRHQERRYSQPYNRRRRRRHGWLIGDAERAQSHDGWR
jgi:carbonic anhydrase/acetyltransferase-like protein (isoleucine patch superfamily)